MKILFILARCRIQARILPSKIRLLLPEAPMTKEGRGQFGEMLTRIEFRQRFLDSFAHPEFGKVEQAL